MYTKSGLCRSAGNGPTISMPGTSISSLMGCMPISASPRWTTSPTRGELWQAAGETLGGDAELFEGLRQEDAAGAAARWVDNAGTACGRAPGDRAV